MFTKKRIKNSFCYLTVPKVRIGFYIAAGLLANTLFAQPLESKTFQATPETFTQSLIDNLPENSEVVLEEGVYQGNFIINKTLRLTCKNGSIIDGNGTGNVFVILASNTVVEGCDIKNWGGDLTAMDAGIVIKRTAKNVTVKNNRFSTGISFAIFLDASENTSVLHNHIKGNANVRSQDRGNGIHLYAAKGADIAFNTVTQTRDGIYIDTSNENTIRDNEFHHLRYGVHYMYSYRNVVKNNYTHDTRTGYALMQSKFLTVTNNKSENDQNYGILMNYITNSTIKDNQIINVSYGRNMAGGAIKGAEGKALFMYNSLFNNIEGNTLKNSELGIHLTAGSEDNNIHKNNFIGNQTQVKYVSNREQEWSVEQTGNFWSDYLGWDRNNDRLGDVPYEPNDSIDKLLWKYPAAKILMNSPAIATLRWIQREFPVLKSPGVKDSYPLMQVHQPTESLTSVN